MLYYNIEKKVLQKITPSDLYRKKIKDNILELNNLIKKEIAQKRLPVKIQLVGSIAKDTYLMNNMDIDFFICFPRNYKKDEIAKNTLIIGKKILENTEESYAEHPYIRGYYKGCKTEIVPCYQIENANQKLSAVDRTPLHTKFVKENISEKQRQEVRLLKQFLKGINCYGAEAQIEGFSGYLCEILILYYNTFEDTIKNVKNWKQKEKLSLKKGNFPNFNTPLTFIDPVDPERNVASAVSRQKYDMVKKAAEEYLLNPKITFFFPNKIKPWSLNKIKNILEKDDNRYLGIEIEKPDIIDENLYPQIKKAAKSIEKNSKKNDFSVKDAKYLVKNKSIYIIIKTKTLSINEEKTHIGPPINKKENSEDFKNKWNNNKRVLKKPYIKNKRWYVDIKRKYTNIQDFLDKEFKNLSLGKHLDKIRINQYKILEQKDLLNKDLKVFWTEYLDGKMSWER